MQTAKFSTTISRSRPRSEKIVISNPEHVLDTTTIQGFEITKGEKGPEWARGFFLKGCRPYIYGSKYSILSEGCDLLTSLNENNIPELYGECEPGVTGCVGMSTTVSYELAVTSYTDKTLKSREEGYPVILIDGRYMPAGIIIPNHYYEIQKQWRYRRPFIESNPMVRKCLEVNLPYSIPTSHIVGTVSGHCYHCPKRGFLHHIILQTNPAYKGSFGEIVHLLNEPKLYTPKGYEWLREAGDPARLKALSGTEV